MRSPKLAEVLEEVGAVGKSFVPVEQARAVSAVRGDRVSAELQLRAQVGEELFELGFDLDVQSYLPDRTTSPEDLSPAVRRPAKPIERRGTARRRARLGRSKCLTGTS